ncbi:MAG: HIT domain-containing protein, partial [candidate division Zixibacteria bacterium]
MSDCIFCDIVGRERSARILHEDDDCMAFEDVNPQAPVHFLVIPKKHIETVLDGDENILGKLLFTASR